MCPLLQERPSGSRKRLSLSMSELFAEAAFPGEDVGGFQVLQHDVPNSHVVPFVHDSEQRSYYLRMVGGVSREHAIEGSISLRAKRRGRRCRCRRRAAFDSVRCFVPVRRGDPSMAMLPFSKNSTRSACEMP